MCVLFKCVFQQDTSSTGPVGSQPETTTLEDADGRVLPFPLGQAQLRSKQRDN